MRYRKNPRRKRRLAYARSGLMINLGNSKESEYWSFPLPPMSPHVSCMKSSASSVDVRALKVKVPTEEMCSPPMALICMQAAHVYAQKCFECWIALELPISAQQPTTTKKELSLIRRKHFPELFADLILFALPKMKNRPAGTLSVHGPM